MKEFDLSSLVPEQEESSSQIDLSSLTPDEGNSSFGDTAIGFFGGVAKVGAGLGESLGLIPEEDYKRFSENYKKYEQEHPIAAGLGKATGIMAGGITGLAAAPTMGAVATGAVAGLGMGAAAGGSRLAELKAEGVDPDTAALAASSEQELTAIGGAIPIAKAGGLLTRALSGGAWNTALGELDVGAQNEILKDYPELQYSELDPTRMGISFAVGGLLGGAFGQRAQAKIAKEIKVLEDSGNISPEQVTKIKQSAYEHLKQKEVQALRQLEELNAVKAARQDLTAREALDLDEGIETVSKELEDIAKNKVIFEKDLGIQPEQTPTTFPRQAAPDEQVPIEAYTGDTTKQFTPEPKEVTLMPKEQLEAELTSSTSPERATAIVDELVNRTPTDKVQVLGASKEEEALIRSMIKTLGLEDTSIKLDLSNTERGGLGHVVPNDAGVDVNIHPTEDVVARIENASPEIKELYNTLPEKQRVAFRKAWVIAHELGHVTLYKLFQTQLWNGHVKSVLDDFSKWVKEKGTIGVYKHGAILPDIAELERSFEYYSRFDEYFAQRIAYHLANPNGKIPGVFAKFISNMRQIWKTLVSGKVPVNAHKGIDDLIKAIISDNAEMIKATGKTLWETKAGEILNPKEAQVKIQELLKEHGHVFRSSTDAAAEPYVHVADLRPLVESTISDIPFISSKLIMNLFGKQQAVAILNHPLLKAIKGVIRNAEAEATKFSNELFLGTVPYTKKYFVRLSHIESGDAPSILLRESTNEDKFIVHELLRRGFEEKLNYADTKTKYGSHLTESQAKLYDSLTKMFGKMYQKIANQQAKLGKKHILPYREGWYPAVRSGDFYVDVSVHGAIGYREHFRSQIEADNFAKKIKESNTPLTANVGKREVDTSYDAGMGLLQMAKEELDKSGKTDSTAVIDELITKLSTRGGKLGKHHEYRYNLPGYKGTELFRSKEELGRRWGEAVHQSVDEYSNQLKKMIINHSMKPVLEGEPLKQYPNLSYATNLMYDVAMNRIQNPISEYVRNTIDNAMSHIAKAAGKEYYPSISTLDRTHGLASSFFYMYHLMTRPTFLIGQVLTPITTIPRILLREGNIGTAMEASAKGMYSVMNPNDELRKIVHYVAQNRDTLHPQFINDLNKVEIKGLGNLQWAKKTMEFFTGMSPSTAADSFSRYWTLCTMYNFYKAKGYKGKQLLEAMVESTDEAAVQYGRSNKAPVYQKAGILGEAASPLMTFSQAQFGNLLADFATFVRTKQGKDALPFIATFMSLSLVGGVMALPFVLEYEALRRVILNFYPEWNERIPSIEGAVIGGNDRIISHGVLAETGYDIGSSVRMNAVLGGMLIGDRSPIDMFPAVSFAIQQAGYVAEGINPNKTKAQAREAHMGVVPGGYKGLVDDIMYDAANRKYVPNKTGDATVKQTDQERMATYLGTRTMSTVAERTRLRLAKEQNARIMSKASGYIEKIADGVQAKNQMMINTYINKLNKLGALDESVASKIQSEMIRRNIPEYIRVKYGTTGSISGSKARNMLELERLEGN